MARTPARRLALAVLLLAVAARAEAPLIPREVLFGNPERTRPQLSPDGKRLAWLQPDKGVLQVWVQTLGKDDAAPVSADRQRPIRRFQWGQDSRTILYSQDVKGDENWHVYGVDLESKQVRDLTPFEGARADLVADSPRRPNEILVQINLKDRARMDVYRVDLRTGAVVLDTRNPGNGHRLGGDGRPPDQGRASPPGPTAERSSWSVTRRRVRGGCSPAWARTTGSSCST